MKIISQADPGFSESEFGAPQRDPITLAQTDGAPDGWGFLGLTLAALGRWPDAVPCQERAMRLAPSVQHGLHLSETLQWLNRLDEAERVLRECLVIDSASTDIKRRWPGYWQIEDATRKR